MFGLSGLGLKLGLYALGGAAIIVGIIYWHTNAITKAEQAQAAATRTEAVNEAVAAYERDLVFYNERIANLESKLAAAKAKRVVSVERVVTITKEAEKAREELPALDNDAVLIGIRQRLPGPAAAPAVTR